MGQRNLTLREWIDQKGIEKVAEILGVHESAVAHWRRGHCLPRTDHMLKIKKATRGQVSCDSMIETFYSK